MSVMMRGDHWHYRFQIGNKRVSGPCLGCQTEAQAKAYEEQKKRSALAEMEFAKQADIDVKRNRTVRALVENYRRELTGGSLIALSDAHALASAKPSRRVSKSSYGALRETYWNDFTAFLGDKFPDIRDLSAIRRSHCEAYVRNLVDNGRFLDPHPVSPKTIREIVSACKWVMSRLEEDAGMVHNPWNGVILPAPDPTAREVFTMDELALIWDGLADEPFCVPLFIVAANSGMTEGDICTLRWDEVDFIGEMIRRDRRKTGVDITAPLLPELSRYLYSIPRTGEYIFPEHARMYLANSTSVSRKVKKFLEDLGIHTTVEKNGRRVSVKDLHSMRHVFCYRAKKAGIPESTIQKMVGHAVLEMTKHYADHDTEADLREQIRKLPALFVGERGDNQGEVERQKLMEVIPSLPIEVVRRWLGELSRGLPGTP